MSILLALLLFIRPFAYAFAILCVISILILAWIFIDEELQERREANDRPKSKAQIIEEKEAEAWKGFFEESFVRGFDSNGAIINKPIRVETEMATAYREMMDRLQLADEKTIGVFDNKEL